jgi:hypothetical protein
VAFAVEYAAKFIATASREQAMADFKARSAKQI